jgi:hypothetical protein
VLGGEGVEGDEVLVGVLQEPADLRRDRRQAFQDVPEPFAGVVAVFGVEHLAQGGGDETALVAAAVGGMSLTKCTVQRCHGQPSTRAMACLSPSC